MKDIIIMNAKIVFGENNNLSLYSLWHIYLSLSVYPECFIYFKIFITYRIPSFSTLFFKLLWNNEFIYLEYLRMMYLCIMCFNV